jgi:hypothetical protein
MAEELFHCCWCCGPVVLSGATGRTYRLSRELDVPIPDDFLMPTCTKCGEYYFNDDNVDQLEAMLRKKHFAEHGTLPKEDDTHA